MTAFRVKAFVVKNSFTIHHVQCSMFLCQVIQAADTTNQPEGRFDRDYLVFAESFVDHTHEQRFSPNLVFIIPSSVIINS